MTCEFVCTVALRTCQARANDLQPFYPYSSAGHPERCGGAKITCRKQHKLRHHYLVIPRRRGYQWHVQKAKQFFANGSSEPKKIPVVPSILARGNARALPASRMPAAQNF